MRILEFGEVPPPFGGVTVHLRRLLNRLVDDGFDLSLVARQLPQHLDRRIPYVRWPTLPRYVNHFEFLRGLNQPFGTGVLHLHTNPVFFAPLVWLHIVRGGLALITVHDESVGERLSRAPWHEQVCFRLLTRSNRVRWIAVSDPIRGFLRRRGIPADQISVIPAYLTDQGDESSSNLPDELAGFLLDHPESIVVYGYKREFLAGHDLYGFYFALDVLAKVVSSRPQVGLVMLCPDGDRDAEPWKQLTDMAKSMAISQNVLFFLRPISRPLVLWQQCTVMIRPTLTDGDSVAVREMLALGRAVIASNVAPRPAFVKVLPLGSSHEWADAVLECLAATDTTPIGTVADQ